MKMKKIGLFLAGALFATSIFAQTTKQSEIEAKEVVTSYEIYCVRTAFQLANYGLREEQDNQEEAASSLLCAAEILSKVPKLNMDSRKEVSTDSKKQRGALAAILGFLGNVSSSSSANPELTGPDIAYMTNHFFEEGRNLAKSTKNKTLLAYAKIVEKEINKRQFGKPLYYYMDYVEAHDKRSYDVRFSAGQPIEIFVGSLFIDLGLYVYDQNWNLIAKNTSSEFYNSSTSWVRFVPHQGGNFRIVVVNNSDIVDGVSFELYYTN